MKKLLSVTMLTLWGIMSITAQTWPVPQVPGSDLTSLSSDTYVYVYNVEANSFISYGMEWGTNACCTRLTNGESAASIPQRCYAFVNDGKVSIQMVEKSGNYVSCLSDGMNNVYVDQDQNREFTFTETSSGSKVYTLTNVNYSLPLDVFWDRGGHLTLASGKGHTKWAFITETSVTDGSFAKYRAKVQLYNVYKAIVDAGKTSTYSSQITTAYSTYNNTSATATQLRSAATTLFKASATDISGVDVSFLFDNADMSASGNCDSWNVSKNIAWGEFEQYHATITLTQTKSVPQGIYDVAFRSLYRQDGSDNAPALTTVAENTVVADVPNMSDIYFDVGNANNNGWTSGVNYNQPNNMQSAGQALLHPDAIALAHNVIVPANGSIAVTLNMTSTSQWLNWQGVEVTYLGNSTNDMKAELYAAITEADGIYNSTYNGAAALKSVLDNAKAVYNNSSATAIAIDNAKNELIEAIATYRFAAACEAFPFDYNDKLKNPSFENSFNNWTNVNMQTQTNTAFNGKDQNTYVEKWVGAGNSVGDGSVKQTITGLGIGKYMLKAQAQNIQEGSSASQQNAWIIGNIDKKAVTANGEYTLIWVNIENNPVIGFIAEGATGNWIGVDNFRLYYIGGDLSDFKTELRKYITDAQSVQSSKMENSVRSALETAISNANSGLNASSADGFPALVEALKTAKSNAETSIKAFQNLQNAINIAESRYNGSMSGSDVFLAAINQAKSVNNNLNSTQAQMAAEITNLEKAYRRFLVANGSGPVPAVTTDSRYARGAIEAFGRMSYSGISDDQVLEAGFCYSTTNTEPTVLDECATGYLSWGGKIYRMPMTPGTVYYMRPYVITKSYAVGYGDVIKMSTLPMGNVTYTYYNNNGGDFHNNKNNKALTEACWYWTNYTSINGFHVTANYSSGTPTADCGYGGNMRIGSNTGQRTGTMMHEMNHGVGCGTLGIWGGWENSYLRTSMNGDWAGERANGALRFWENRNDLVICGAYDNAHWGFRPFNGVYENNSGGTSTWENKYAFNGAHLEPGAWAGPSDWNGTQAVYIGNSIITQGMMEDGLIPVNAWSGGFCLPAYVFVQYDNKKYYIKNENDKRGLFDSFLTEGSNGVLTWSTIPAGQDLPSDNAAWYITFDASRQYYQFRNASTGHYINYTANGTNGFKANGNNSTVDAAQFHLIRGRNDVKVEGTVLKEGLRGYWMMRINGGGTPSALTADASKATSATSVNLWDSGTNQRWMFLTAEDMPAFKSGLTNLALDELRRYLNGYSTAKNVAHNDKVTGATTALTNTINSINTAIAGTVTLEQVEQYISDIKSAGLTFLNNTKPSGTVPYDLTFLIDNPSFTNSSNGWSLDPTRNYGAVEFYQSSFDFYQTLTGMPAGTYQLTANAFQRPGSNADVYTAYTAGNDNVNAVLYINTTSEKIKNQMSEQQTSSISSGEYQTTAGTYVPNNMQSGSAYFNHGKYSNSVQGEFASGNLRIGLRGTTGTSYWVMADNFRLYYYGTDGTVTSLKDQLVENGFTKISALPNDYSPYFFVLYDHDQDLTMVEKNPNHQGGSKSMWYDADINPMTSKEPLWTMDSFVDGSEYQVLANATNPDYMLQTEYNAAYHYRCSDNGAGNVGWGSTLFAYDSNNQYWTVQNGIYPNEGYLGPWNNVITDDAETALNKKDASQGHFDVFTILRGDWVKRFEPGLADASSNNPVNISYVLENPGGERRNIVGWKTEGAGWSTQGSNALNGKVSGYFIESWNNNGLASTDLYQVVSGLPNGTYRFSAIAHCSSDCYLYANNVQVAMPTDNPGTRTQVVVYVSDGTIRVGAKTGSNPGRWIAFDDAQLEYLGAYYLLDETSASAPVAADNVTLKFNRSIIGKNNGGTDNAWNTICFPFALNAQQIEDIFGTGTVVKKLSSVSGIGNNYTFLTFSDASSISANVPYIMQVETSNAKSEYIIENINVAPSENLTQTVDGIQFVGNYIYPKVLDNDGGEDYYILNDVFKKSKGETKLKGFRAYFHVPSGLGIKSLGFDIEGDATSIDGINVQTINFPADIYTIGGQIIRQKATDLEGLPAGIYFINGKKVLVK